MLFLELSIASIRSRLLTSLLCVFAVAAGVAMLCLLGVMSQSLSNGFTANARGIDMVVGKKGSALQLVLSSVYHIDVPNGNMEMADFQKLAKLHQVKNIIPLALGDNYRGFRIVGTTPDYVTHYKGALSEGRMFTQPFEAVAGAMTDVAIGAEFAGAHGYAADSDDVHDFHLYKIVGRLKPTGTVLDRLILTSVESVQQLHAPHAGHDDDDDHDSPEKKAAEEAVAHQVTAALIELKSPAAVLNLSRGINRTENLQAAVPSYEMARLATNLGIGRDILIAAGLLFSTLALFMLVSSLLSNLSLRRYDLAIMRVMGASPASLAGLMMLDGIILTSAGVFVGLVIGHAAAFAIVSLVPALAGLILPIKVLVPDAHDFWLAAAAMVAGLAASLVPALLVMRSDIAEILVKGRV